MRKHAFEHAVAKGAEPYEGDDKTLDWPCDQGDRRVADLFHRPVLGYLALQRGIRLGLERPSRGGGVLLPRSPDPQRVQGQHGHVVPVLRRSVQFPRDPVLRHRGQVHRASVPRADLALRPHPHPDQRGPGRDRADRELPQEIQGRRHPAHRRGRAQHLRRGRRDRRARRPSCPARRRRITARASSG
jgi:hypothetical protein